jgi:hypothetical protein
MFWFEDFLGRGLLIKRQHWIGVGPVMTNLYVLKYMPVSDMRTRRMNLVKAA